MALRPTSYDKDIVWSYHFEWAEEAVLIPGRGTALSAIGEPARLFRKIRIVRFRSPGKVRGGRISKSRGRDGLPRDFSTGQPLSPSACAISRLHSSRLPTDYFI